MIKAKTLINDKTIALVMAAGSSRRFGADKRLARLSNGETLLAQTVSNIVEAGLEYKIAIPVEDKVLFAQFYSEEALILINNAQRGIGASIAEAVSSIRNSHRYCLICLADMPYVLPETYKTIATAIAHYDAVIPTFEGKKGNPVAISNTLFEAFSQLDGDTGGRNILKASDVNRLTLEVNDPGILMDIDRVSDL